MTRHAQKCLLIAIAVGLTTTLVRGAPFNVSCTETS